MTVPTMHSKDILHQAKGGSSWLSLLRSDGSRDDQAGGGWSGRAVAQRRPRVWKLGLEGLSNYHSNETVVEASRWRASGPNKKGYSHGIATQKGIELDNSSKPNLTRAKGSLPEKNTTSKKELLTLTLGNVAEVGDVVAQWIERQTASVVVPGSNLAIS